MKRKNSKRFMAMTLAAALVFSGVVVKPSKAADDTLSLAEDTATGSSTTLVDPSPATTGSATKFSFAPTKEGLNELVKGNALMNIPPIAINGSRVEYFERNDNQREMLTKTAQDFKKKGALSTMYQIYDMNRDGIQELFLRYPSGVRVGLAIGEYDHSTYGTKILKKLDGIDQIYKKKETIVLQGAGGAKSVSYTTYKLTSAGKLKKVVTYQKNGKKFQKNKKKISKKVFNKYVKSLKKLKTMKFKNVPKTEFEYMKQKSTTYISSDLYYNNTYYPGYSEITVMKRDDKAEQAQNKRIAFSAAFDKIGNEYSSEPALKRYVFGPDVVDSKTGKTFQAEEFNRLLGEKFGIEFACGMFSMSVDDNEDLIVPGLELDDVMNLKTAENDFTMNGKTYKTMEYTFGYGDLQVIVRFFKDGYVGRPQSVEYHLPSTGDDIPVEEWVFWYGESSQVDGQMWDPVITAQVAGTAVKDGVTGAKNRTLTINATNDAKLAPYQQTITVNENVAFELFSDKSGQFYTYRKDGKTKWNLPLTELDDDEFKEIDDQLNPATGQLTYGDAKFTMGLFWSPTTLLNA